MEPIICFGQQPAGFFPKRFLIAKINTAKNLQKDIGGKIVFFYHDSDADYRETITVLRDRKTGAEVRLNFTQENKLQKNFSPLYLKRITKGWKQETLKQLPRFIDIHPPLTPPLKGGETAVIPSPSGGGLGRGVIDLFMSVDAANVADFCLEMYKKLGLLDGIEIVRSSDRSFREQAIFMSSRPSLPKGDERRPARNDFVVAKSGGDPLTTDKLQNLRDSSSDALLGMTQVGSFADVEYQGEIVRAKIENDRLSLHEGGARYIFLPKPAKISKQQISAAANQRMAWMQSVINCSHYIYGEGEKDYLKFDDFPNIKFIQRDKIDNPDFAWLPN